MLAPIAAAATVSLSLLAYGMMSPRSQLFGPQLWRLEGAGRSVALTFDDGPQEPHTSGLLDLLAAEAVPATFFVLGRQVERHPETLERLIRENHAVGIHGWSHARLPFVGGAALAAELDRTLALVPGARLFRAPYGWKDPRLFRLAERRGLTLVGWSAAGGDWRRGSPQAIAARLLRRVGPGAIVLLHDGCGEDSSRDRSRSVEAAALLIRELKRQGYGFLKL